MTAQRPTVQMSRLAWARIWRRVVLTAAGLAMAPALLAAPPAAASTWQGLKTEIFGTRTIEEGFGTVSIKAPPRPDDMRAVPIAIDVALEPGRSVRRVSLIVDENPSPLAAVFKIGGTRERVAISTKVRINQGTFVRAVVEADDGRLYMASSLVKFAGGQAACSAPPTGDPAEIAANMGKMKLAAVPSTAAASPVAQRVRLDLSHPNHTGMALDQMTLLYIPLRMVAKLEVRQGAEPVLDMDGSITLAENPTIEFDFKGNGAEKLAVTLKDSDGAEWTRELAIAPAS